MVSWESWRLKSLETLQWRHKGHHGVANHRCLECLLNRRFRRRSRKTSKLCVTCLCEGNSPGAGNADNVSIWWRHHELDNCSATKRHQRPTGKFPWQRPSNAENISMPWRHHRANYWFVFVRWRYVGQSDSSPLRPPTINDNKHLWFGWYHQGDIRCII